MKRTNKYLAALFLLAAFAVTCGIEIFAQQNSAEQTNSTPAQTSPPVSKFGVGDRIQVVRKDGKTYQAVVTEVKEGGYKVHFADSKNSQDEMVAATAVLPLAQNDAASSAQIWKVGDKVGAQWSKDQKYYGANVIAVENGRYKVHYIGDSDSNDEWLEASHLRSFKDWTWTDAAGQAKTLPDLRSILAKHKQWLDSGGQAGAQANLSGANLTNAPLVGANLERANLEKANLSGAQLKGAVLNGANLKGANLTHADLAPTFVSEADLSNAFLVGADLSGADLSKSNLTGAMLVGTHLNKAFLVNADLDRSFRQRRGLERRGF